MNRQRLVVAAAAAVAAVAKGGTAVAHAAGSGWNWFVGDERAHIGEQTGLTILNGTPSK